MTHGATPHFARAVLFMAVQPRMTCSILGYIALPLLWGLPLMLKAISGQ